ncbi:MAG: hypothetical protein ING19_17265 [Azospirillum sp.]|nr:hypothetical protein [Azospirillum sp.]
MPENPNRQHFGRPPIGERAMTATERARRLVEAKRARGEKQMFVELPAGLLDRARQAARETKTPLQKFVANAITASLGKC